ncbi:MAG: Ig-like domain-containing protein [Polyangiaceae bacterium]|nr:Ig-like domain-containing protein [Polyangiaceae bacterium]
MAASFPESAIIKVSSNDSPSPNTLLTLSGDGTTFDPSAALTTDEDGVAKTTLTSTLPSPSIEIHATNPSGKSGHLTCTLPVQTGALWIDPKHLANDTIHVVSPVQHRHAYLTFFNHQSRLLGTRLPLIPDASGNASASMAKPTFENFWILASPDPPGTGVERELTAWPITPNPNEPADAATISTPLLIDGFPDAIAVARDKRRTNRFRTLLILATASLVESGLIYLRLRNARHRINALEQELDLPLDGSGIGGATLWTVMVVVAFLVAVAFGSLALVSWIGGG